MGEHAWLAHPKTWWATPFSPVPLISSRLRNWTWQPSCSGAEARKINMRDGTIEMHMVNGKGPLALPRGLLQELSSPGSAEPAAAERALSIPALAEQCRREIQAYRRGEPSNEAYGLELLYRAIVQGDQDAWAGIQQCLSEQVRGWLYGHPRREPALRREAEEAYGALAFDRSGPPTPPHKTQLSTLP